MKKIIVTNNKKVENKFSGKAEVKMLSGVHRLDVLKKGREFAAKGGQLLINPSHSKGSYYGSLIFLMEDGDKPNEKSLSMIDKCIDDLCKSPVSNKEPLFSGIFQGNDLDAVAKAFG